MTYIPVTAFRRPLDAAQIERAHRPTDESQSVVNKWEILRELIAARAAFGLDDRALAVLEALVSFHTGTVLGGNDGPPIVHPSNAAICERLKGMPSSTMRRHLARLVAAGLVGRRDSPNGKRYVRRGHEAAVFGFDLTPLIERRSEICAAAEAARAAVQALARLRETVSLMRRDLIGLASYGATQRPGLRLWDQFSDMAALSARVLRRKPETAELEALRISLLKALDVARDILEPESSAEDMSTNGFQSEQHYQNSKTDSYDLEPCLEQAKAAATAPDHEQHIPDEIEAANAEDDRTLPRIPLGLVLSVCPEIQGYAESPIRHWHGIVRAAEIVRPMMGISPSAWDDARDAMGPEQAAVVLAAMLERFSDIHSPGGYLRSLTAKADQGSFSCGPMIMALMRRAA